jgi:hypothetical protein
MDALTGLVVWWAVGALLGFALFWPLLVMAGRDDE